MKRPKLPPAGTLVAIRWEDAAFDLDDQPGTMHMTTVGWLAEVTKTQITIAGEQEGEGEYRRSFTTVPRSLIREVHHLVPAPEAR